MTLKITRVAQNDTGTYGVLLVNGAPFAVTLEPKVPVIQEGQHLVLKSFFNRGGYNTYEIQVYGHSRILFHKGNYAKDTEGCVLLGSYFMPGWIAMSTVAFDMFMHAMDGVDAVTLTVVNAF